jgi:hypothetical protein
MEHTDEQQWKQRLHTECAKLRRENNVDINPAKLCAISKQLYGSQVKHVLREADSDAALNIILRDVTAAATKSIQDAHHARYIPSPTNHTTLEFNGRRIDSSGSTQQLYADPSIFPKTLTPNMNSAAQQQTESQIVDRRIPINTSKNPKISREGRHLKKTTTQAARHEGGESSDITDGKGGTADDRGGGRTRTTAAKPQDK